MANVRALNNPILSTKSITENGTYDAIDDNANGYSQVSVDVPSDPATIVSKTITANGTYNASSDSADGYDPVVVNVPGATIVSKSITANGTYNASSDSADGYDPVVVNVPGANLGTKSITQNGTYAASSDNLDGYSQVTVDVESEYTETSLWTNQSPSSNFATQAVSLSNSVDNFKYIKVRCKFSTSDSAEFSTIVSVDELKTFTGNTKGRLVSGGMTGGGYPMYRNLTYTSSSSLTFGTAGYVNGTTWTTANNLIIPLEILGLNELDHGTILDVTNPMACTPFRNTTPTGGTLTIPSDGTYLIEYIYQTSTGDFVPTVVSGSMTIKQTISEVTTANNYNAQSAKMSIKSFIVEATANTVIRGSVASGNTLAYALKIN